MRCGTVPSALPCTHRALTVGNGSMRSARPGKQQASRARDGWDRMAIFRAYAKVLESGDPAMRIYEAGFRTCPGQPGLLLADVLRRTGGVYETAISLQPQFRDDIREVAELTSDPELLAIADLTEVPVPLDHLRGLDPQTRIILVTELCYEADEGTWVSRAREHRAALATIMPDGTVIAGDAFRTAPAATS
jgi:hypothetical protein